MGDLCQNCDCKSHLFNKERKQNRVLFCYTTRWAFDNTNEAIIEPRAGGANFSGSVRVLMYMVYRGIVNGVYGIFILKFGCYVHFVVVCLFVCFSQFLGIILDIKHHTSVNK